MSLSPISFSSPKVYFRGEGIDISAPGKFSTTEPEGDKVELSKETEGSADEPKKSGIGKTIGKIAGAIVVLLGASYGMFKWKGDKWLLPEAKGFLAGIKKAIVKPGQLIEDKIIAKIANKGAKKATQTAGEAAEQATEQAATAASEAAEQVAENVAK